MVSGKDLHLVLFVAGEVLSAPRDGFGAFVAARHGAVLHERGVGNLEGTRAVANCDKIKVFLAYARTVARTVENDGDFQVCVKGRGAYCLGWRSNR